MRKFSLFWVAILFLAAACEQRDGSSILTFGKDAPDSSAVRRHFQLVAKSAADSILEARREAEQRINAESEAHLLLLYKAHEDSLKSIAPALALADTTVEAEDFKRGDLNGDGRPDYLVLARGKRPCGAADENSFCRTVFIVINTKKAGLRVATANQGIVGCSDCGGAGVGDPYQPFTISKRGFAISQLYGSCDKTAITVTFRYNHRRQDWFLQARDTWDYSCREDGTNEKTHEGPRDFGLVRFADASVSQ